MIETRTTGLKRAALGLLAALAVAAPAAAGAQLFVTEPNFQRGPIAADDPLVGIPIPGANPSEYRAHMLWNLRSGLNVAALQCQFSPFLRVIDNYNAFLAHHSGELTGAYQSLEGYFRRVHGRTGPRRFDDYSTSTYNNFSTLEAQYGFCQTAGALIKEALTVRKGELHQFAGARLRELRNSLVPVSDTIVAYNPSALRLAPIALAAAPDCTRLRGRERRQCEQQQRQTRR